MRFKYRKFMKKLNICLYIAVLLIVASIFWKISSGKKYEVTQISSSDIKTNKIERIVSIGNDKETSSSSDNKDDENTSDTDDEDDADIDDDDLDDDDLDDDETTNTSTVTIKDGDVFVVNLDDPIDFVNIRSEANAESSILGKLTYGSGGTVVEAGSEWSKITSGDITGYVKNEFCLFGDDASKKIEEIGGYTAVVNTDSVKVRSEMSTDSSVLGLVGIGQEFTCKKPEDNQEWIAITFEGQTGYVSREFVTITSKTATAN